MISEARKRIVAEARTWIGTPFAWGGKRKGAAVDCAHLVEEAWRAACPEFQVEYPQYGQVLRRGELARYLRKYCIPANDPLPGDVALVTARYYNPRDYHLALLTDRGTVIHVDDRRVVEHGATAEWSRRVLDYFSAQFLVREKS